MKTSSSRLGLVAGVVIVSVAGAWALANPNPGMPPPLVTKCPQPACTDVCDMSIYTIGYCTKGKNGKAFVATYQCCCCGEGTDTHWFHGE
jgi:hypothetical protein